MRFIHFVIFLVFAVLALASDQTILTEMLKLKEMVEKTPTKIKGYLKSIDESSPVQVSVVSEQECKTLFDQMKGEPLPCDLENQRNLIIFLII